jgi:arabinogalactan oligomer / maltooligosaccharide transport system substrate-binding protein
MKKLFFLLALVSLLIACPGSNDTKSSGSTITPSITIAVEPSYVAYFQAMVAEYKKTTDINVEIVATGMFDVLDALSIQKGNSADIFMVVNDRIGDLAEQRLIAPLSFSPTGYTDNARAAGTYNGSMYFVPMSTDTTLLIYNKDKVSTLPTTLSSIPASNWAAKFTDFFHAAGMLYTKGGYVFGSSDTDLGVANAGSIAAGQAIGTLYNSGVSHWSLMKDDTISYDVMMKVFADGEVDFIINGPWALADIAKSGINAGVAPVPSWDGSHPYQALTSTKGMSINGYSKNSEAAQKFLQFLSSPANAQLWYEMTDEVAPHTGITYPEGSLQAIAFTATSGGANMSNLPTFKTIWEPMADALKQIANAENAEAALKAAEARLIRDIADVKAR